MPQQDACALLDSDHQKVERLFAQCQWARDSSKKSQLAQALRKATGDHNRVDEAEQEHQDARDLITQIEDGKDMDPLMAELMSNYRPSGSGPPDNSAMCRSREL